MTSTDKTSVEVPKTPENANFEAKNEAIKDISDIFKELANGGKETYSSDILYAIFQKLRSKELVMEGIHIMMKTGEKEDLYTRRGVATHFIPGIESDGVFIAVYPEAFTEFFLSAKNTYGPENKFGWVDKQWTKKALSVGIPIPSRALLLVLKRTKDIISSFYNRGDMCDFTPDTEASRAFFQKCFELCDWEPNEIEQVRFAMQGLDQVLVGWPKKMLAGPVETSSETKAVSKDVAFLDWNPGFVKVSEWKIVKSLRDLSDIGGKRVITKQHAKDIAESINILYADQIEDFKLDAESLIKFNAERTKTIRPETSEALFAMLKDRNYSAPFIPIGYFKAGKYESHAGNGFSSPKKWGFSRGLFINFLDEVEGLIRKHAIDREVEEVFNQTLLSGCGIYFPVNLIRFAFLGRKWALDAFGSIDVNFWQLQCVRKAQLRLNPGAVKTLASENAKKLSEASGSIAGNGEEFSKILVDTTEQELFIKDDNRNYSKGLVDSFHSVFDSLLIAREKLEDEWTYIKEDRWNGIRGNEGLETVESDYANAFWSDDRVFDAVMLHASKCSNFEEFNKAEYLNWISYSQTNEGLISKYVLALFEEFLRKSGDEALKFVLKFTRVPRNVLSWDTMFMSKIPFDSVSNKLLFAKTIRKATRGVKYMRDEWLYDNFSKCFQCLTEWKVAKASVTAGLITEEQYDSVLESFYSRLDNDNSTPKEFDDRWEKIGVK